jgi:hypothetical protein
MRICGSCTSDTTFASETWYLTFSIARIFSLGLVCATNGGIIATNSTTGAPRLLVSSTFRTFPSVGSHSNSYHADNQFARHSDNTSQGKGILESFRVLPTVASSFKSQPGHLLPRRSWRVQSMPSKPHFQGGTVPGSANAAFNIKPKSTLHSNLDPFLLDTDVTYSTSTN